MSDLYVFSQVDGLWLPYGGGPGGPITPGNFDPFVPGVTEPSASNMGPGLGGFRALDYNLDRIDNNVTVAAGDTLANKVINGWVNIPVGAELVNCDVRGAINPPAPSSSSHRPLVKVTDHVPTVNGPRAKLTHCKVFPQTISGYWSTAIGYYGWETDRVYAGGTTDILAARSNASGNGLANVYARDSWFGSFIQWDPDPVTTRNPAQNPYLGTHNDVLQLEGNTGGANDIRFLNCTFYARALPTAGQPSSNPTYWHEPTSMAVVVGSPNTKDRIGASWNGCYFYGGAYNCINLGGTGTNWSIVFLDNKFERPGAPGVPTGYPRKPFVLHSSIPRDASTVARNYFMDNGAVVNPVSG